MNSLSSRKESFDVPDRIFRVRDIPSTPLRLFGVFLPYHLVKIWVSYTNNVAAANKAATAENS